MHNSPIKHVSGVHSSNVNQIPGQISNEFPMSFCLSLPLTWVTAHLRKSCSVFYVPGLDIKAGFYSGAFTSHV